MLYARSGFITIGRDVINRLILILYFPEFTLKLFERTEALMLVSVAQVYNPLSFWLPPDNPDWDAVVVFEPSVECSHSTFPAWPLKSPTTQSANW